MDEKHQLIYKIYEDLQSFMDLYKSKYMHPDVSDKKPRATLADKDKALFYLAFSLRDALASLFELCDPGKENIGMALVSTGYWQDIKRLFPEHARSFS